MSSFSLEINKLNALEYDLEVVLNGKFKEDECYFENERFVVVLTGVILNKKIFLESKVEQSWEEVIINLYLQKGDCFYNEFRGSFCGVFLDKMNGKWIIYQDHIGSKNVYISYLEKDSIYFTTSILDAYKTQEKKEKRERLDINAAYMLLTYGFMLEDYTLFEGVRKILPGSYVKIEGNEISNHSYFKLSNTPNNNLSEDEIIDKMDCLFKKAIKRQFEKDIEYGYKHFVALSGGLDSRMTSWVANKMGYTNQLNFTFSQSGYLDETIPKLISSDLHHEWVFKALDNGLFLKDIENTTKITGGNVIYNGLAHGLSLYKQINFESLGISHSGQLGDVIFGSYDKGIVLQTSFKNGDGAYSRRLLDKVDFKQAIKEKHNNYELFCMYQRGFNGINDGLMGIQQYTETMSPFYDVDVFKFALTIPIKYRSKQKIYKKWILTKYPEAANYIWEKTGERINSPSFFIKNKEITVNKLYRKVLIKTGIKKIGYNSKNNMNPIEYWIDKNENLRKYLNGYFIDNINFVKNSQLKTDCINQYNSGNGIEKMQVISLLCALKLFFN